jgi:pimeloyl-ACP methyl ester carboxylesterase
MPAEAVPVERRQKILRGLNTAWLYAAAPAKPDAPVLLFLHGFPDSPESWSFQLARFAGEFEIVAPYVRGAGPSVATAELGRYTPGAVGLDVLQILDTVDPGRKKPVCVVGHDLGAVHAWYVAGVLKQRTAALVVINGLTIKQMAKRLRRPAQLAKSWYIFAMQMPWLPELALGKFAKRFVARAHAAGGLTREREPDLEACAGAVTGPLNQYRAFMRQMPRDLGRRAPRLRCPVLILWGHEDAFLVPPTTAEFEADAADLTVRILAGNHWLHREQADEVNKILADFLAAAADKRAAARSEDPLLPHALLRTEGESDHDVRHE